MLDHDGTKFIKAMQAGKRPQQVTAQTLRLLQVLALIMPVGDRNYALTIKGIEGINGQQQSHPSTTRS